MLDSSLLQAASFPGPVACDTETSGVHWWRDTVGVVSFAWGGGDSDALATRNVAGSLVALQCRMDAGLPTVFHNSGFDLHFLDKLGLRIRWSAIHDTLLKARLLNNLAPHDLDALGLSVLGIAPGKNVLKSWLVANKKKFLEQNGRVPNYLDVPDEILIPYATRDASLTWKLWDAYRQMGFPLYEREREVRRLMFDAETRGVEVDVPLIEERRKQAQHEEGAVTTRLQAYARDIFTGESGTDADINLDSNPQLVKWLYSDLGLTPASYTDGGAAGKPQPQVNEFNLMSNPHPVTRLLNTRNKRHKTGEFFDSYLALRDTGNVLHPTINTMQARTHRFSLSDPNLQQIPVRGDRFHVRECFVSGAGWFIGADYDKQELRIAAEIAGDTALIAALMTGVDVYVAMAEKMLGKLGITGGERQAAKIAVLSMIYGAGAPKVAESFTVNTGHPYTVERAKVIRSNFYAAYPELHTLMNTMQDQARRTGHLQNAWGRDLYVERERAYVATDYIVQSSGRDVLADALLNVATVLPRYGGHLLWPIHDECLMWVPEEPTPELLKEVGEAMVSTKFSHPLTAKPKYGKTLAELK